MRYLLNFLLALVIVHVGFSFVLWDYVFIADVSGVLRFAYLSIVLGLTTLITLVQKGEM